MEWQKPVAETMGTDERNEYWNYGVREMMEERSRHFDHLDCSDPLGDWRVQLIAS